MARSNNFDIQSANTPLYGWGMTLDLTGKGYEVGKRVWDTYDHMMAYVNDPNDSAAPGNVLAVVKDPNPKKNGLYIVKQAKNVQLTDATETVPSKLTTDATVTESVVEMVGAGMGVTAVANYTAAVAEATADNIGSLFYAKADEDGHPHGLYVVTGAGSLQRLASSSATGSPVETITGDKYVTATREGSGVTLAVDKDKIIAGLLPTADLASTFGLSIGKEDGKSFLYLKDAAGTTTYAKVDASDFVADGFLDSVALSGDDLTFTWNATSGKKATTISLSKYIDAYTAGKGININGRAISVVIPEDDKYLAVDATGVHTKDIDTAIQTAVDAKVIPTTSVAGEGYVTVGDPTVTGNDSKYTVKVTTKTITDASTDANGLATAADVKTYVNTQIANAKIEWETL